MADAELIGRTFVELADTLDERFDLLDYLHGFVARAVEVLGVAEAGVVLAGRRGDLEVLAATSDRVRSVQLLEVRSGTGPSGDAHRSGEPVRAHDLEQARTRWPRFVDAARARGFCSAYALPMRLRSDRIGALELFAVETSGLGPAEDALGRAMADVATIGIVQERAMRERRAQVDQLSEALESRVVLEQAKGVLAVQGGVEVDRGFEQMRRYARDRNLKLAAVARRVVARELSFADLTSR